MSTKLSYADKLGVPFVTFLGEDEITRGQITVKDMLTGGQTTASAGVIIAGLCDKVRVIRDMRPIGGNG